jgi:hypothetical protein
MLRQATSADRKICAIGVIPETTEQRDLAAFARRD